LSNRFVSPHIDSPVRSDGMWRRVLPLFTLLAILPSAGCVTMAATMIWDTATDERSVLEQADDGRIATRIRLAILKADFKALDAVSVFSHRGHVVLVGVAPAGSALPRQVAALANGVEGTKRVNTYFVTARVSRYDDFIMGLEVRSNIIGDMRLKAAQVDVAVVGGHVVLTGLMDRNEKIAAAVAHARAVGGVVKVKSFIDLVKRTQ
jgi:osmotically-inducible protein OsmY